MDGKVLVAPSFDQGVQKTFPLGSPCFPLTVNLHGDFKLPTARLRSADATKGSIHGSLLLGRQVLHGRVKHGTYSVIGDSYKGFLQETPTWDQIRIAWGLLKLVLGCLCIKPAQVVPRPSHPLLSHLHQVLEPVQERLDTRVHTTGISKL